MKQSLIILLLSACAGHAQMWTNVETGAVAPQPSRRPADAVNVPEEWFILPGWQPFDLAQQADWDAAQAAKAEAAAAEAAVESAGKNGKVNDRLAAIEAWIRSHR